MSAIFPFWTEHPELAAKSDDTTTYCTISSMAISGS